jgi:hypothetical protein
VSALSIPRLRIRRRRRPPRFNRDQKVMIAVWCVFIAYFICEYATSGDASAAVGAMGGAVGLHAQLRLADGNLFGALYSSVLALVVTATGLTMNLVGL